MEESVKKYLSKIGREGGRKSRRLLSSETAKIMVKVRMAKRAFKEYYSSCFWSFDPELEITAKDIKWVAEQLMKNGNQAAWRTGRKLCQ